MVVTEWTVLIAVVEVARVFPEALFAFLAGEGEFIFAQERMVFGFRVAFGAVEPLAA